MNRVPPLRFSGGGTFSFSSGRAGARVTVAAGNGHTGRVEIKMKILKPPLPVPVILTGREKDMNSKWIWLPVIMTALVILILLVSAGFAGDGNIIPENAGSESNANLVAVRDVADGLSGLTGQPASVIAPDGTSNYRTRLVLLGTTGGVTWWTGADRASSSSVLVVEDTLYIIDLGQGSTSRLSEVFNSDINVDSTGRKIEGDSPTFLENAKVLFFTHLHQDHTADYPSFLLIGPGAGLGRYTNRSTGMVTIDPIMVIGPGNRGELEADKNNYIKKGGHIVSTDSANPALITTTPGTRQMTSLIWQAYAQTINDMTLDNGYNDFTTLVRVREIGGTEPEDIPMPLSVTDPNNDTCPAMDPFEVYEDENVRVTAILVDHHQVYPAFAYRFDTADGSVVFSGDTGPDTKGNLQRLSKGADILVHEVIDPAWIDQQFGNPEPGTQKDALKTHLMQSHTTIDAVGTVATDCGVPTLVLNHIVPGDTPDTSLQQAKQNFSGTLIIGEDLMEIGIGKAR